MPKGKCKLKLLRPAGRHRCSDAVTRIRLQISGSEQNSFYQRFHLTTQHQQHLQTAAAFYSQFNTNYYNISLEEALRRKKKQLPTPFAINPTLEYTATQPPQSTINNVKRPINSTHLYQPLHSCFAPLNNIVQLHLHPTADSVHSSTNSTSNCCRGAEYRLQRLPRGFIEDCVVGIEPSFPFYFTPSHGVRSEPVLPAYATVR